MSGGQKMDSEPEQPDPGKAYARSLKDRIVREAHEQGGAWAESADHDLRITPRLVIGLAIMLGGLVLALDSLGFVEGGQLFRFWPLALIAVGIVKWISPAPQRMTALFWIVAGVAFQLVTLGRMSFGGVWAALLFFVGAKIAWKALRPTARPTDPAAALDLLQFMGGTKTVVTTQDFKGGQATAVMGGCEIDLRHAAMPEGRAAVLDTFAFWGGIEIRVPDDWEVVSQGNAVLGGFVNNARSVREAKRRIVVTGLAIMGGVEVKN
jgi:predicted membrane protein